MISDQLNKVSILFNEAPALTKWSQVHTNQAANPKHLSKGLEVHINHMDKTRCLQELLRAP